MGSWALPPTVINRPPSSMNLCRLTIPFSSMPPRMSLEVSGELAMFGVIEEPFQGMGSPRLGRPFTIDCADPPTGGKMITSNRFFKSAVSRIVWTEM